MSVDKVTYSAIVVPVLMEKLPKQIQLTMVRGAEKTMLEWTLEEFINALDSELDNNNNNNNNTIYLQLAEEIAKANKGQLYTTFTIFSKNN